MDKAETIRYLKKKAKELRLKILEMIYVAGSGHPGGSLSAADIVTALYFHFLRANPSEPDWPDRDRFILSKGHACPVWYGALAMRGFFAEEELLTLRKIDSRLQGHPDMRKTPGVDSTTGSLGQGLSIGIGMALMGKLDKKDYRVYVMLGCGELDEGQIWEAAMCANKYHLDNLIAIIDYNQLQLDGSTDEVMPLEPLRLKWESFGWQVLEINGHNMEQIVTTIENARQLNGSPTVIIAHTVKGKGVSFMENDPDWHGRVPTEKEFKLAIKELKGALIYGKDDSHKERLWRSFGRVRES